MGVARWGFGRPWPVHGHLGRPLTPLGLGSPRPPVHERPSSSRLWICGVRPGRDRWILVGSGWGGGGGGRVDEMTITKLWGGGIILFFKGQKWRKVAKVGRPSFVIVISSSGGGEGGGGAISIAGVRAGQEPPSNPRFGPTGWPPFSWHARGGPHASGAGLTSPRKPHLPRPMDDNRHQPPTANRHQPPTANRQPPPTATNHQPPTATNHQSPTANRHQPPTANRRANHCSILFLWFSCLHVSTMKQRASP